MDITAHLRLLKAAQGDTAKLALTTVDLAFPNLPEGERLALKETLEAIAIPHWCDETILEALLKISKAECTARLSRLRGLKVVEPFLARGFNAVNIHEATRLALRKRMVLQQPDRFHMLSLRALTYFNLDKTPAGQIERIYHLITSDPKAAVVQYEALDREWSVQGRSEDRYALRLALNELEASGIAPNSARVEVLGRAVEATLPNYHVGSKRDLNSHDKARSLVPKLGWLALALAGAFAFALIALNRGESIGAIWIVVATVCVYTIAYRFYSKFIAAKVLRLDPTRRTPAYKFNDGLDYVPTNKYVLFGHHFAAIAGAGPLVGPILAAQMGYMPGMLWLLAGVVFAGAVQDFTVLFISTRRDGRSLGDLIKSELGQVPGMIALFGTFFIMLVLLAVLALIVVKALAESPWGTFTVAATIPIALLMGVYARYIRPGAIGEVSLIGFVLLMMSIVGGQYVQEIPALAALFTLTGEQLTWLLIAYGFIASVLPVWLLLAPRDYLSTFLKIGTIVGLAIGVIFISPQLKMPAFTQFVDGSGPVWSGSLFPFLFITIACGAVSGFHSLISSGTTPKMIRNEIDARFIGYGAMLMESFVAIMALVAASTLEPGIYFAMNAPAAILGGSAESAAAAISQWGFYVTPEMITQTAKDVGEHTIISRTGGAPTLAVGMAHILSEFAGGKAMMAFWYHFAILFEALFILTAVDAGTRAGRFMLQDLLGTFIPSMKRTDSLVASLVATALCVAGWGYFLYQGVVDPLGGINTLWPLFGISNQMLAGVALILCTSVLFKMKRDRFAWVTIIPAFWVLVCTLTAAWQKIFDANPRIGFLAHANKYKEAVANGQVLAPAKSIGQMQQVIFNDYVNASLAALFMLVLISMLVFGIRTVLHARAIGKPSAKEAPFELLPAEAIYKA